MKRKIHILLVDDTADGREPLAILLRLRGYAVTCAESGAEGLEALDGVETDLLILDLMMPGMSGFEMLERLRRHERWKDLPVLVLSAAPLSDGQRVELAELGARRQLTKASVTFDDLLDAVAGALEQRVSGTA